MRGCLVRMSPFILNPWEIYIGWRLRWPQENARKTKQSKIDFFTLNILTCNSITSKDIDSFQFDVLFF